MAANPQSRIFSPLMVFDVVFSAPYANLYSLVFLGFVGSVGMYKLLIYLEIKRLVAVIVSIIFVHASWFHLHPQKLKF